MADHQEPQTQDWASTHYERCRCRYCVLRRRVDELTIENAELTRRLDEMARAMQGNEQ